MAKQSGVTRPTVRQGLAELRASGLVEAIMGRGTFARSPYSRPGLTRPPKKHTSPPPLTRKNPAHRDPRQDSGQEEVSPHPQVPCPQFLRR
ncbi:hypothetical protein [Streptomyces sp. NPDC006134]|uniref:hypothetical protein n=1 Tax=Streptomyces sp. NPDC006134 TaxID=3154467 RepID=UPI00340DA3EF